MTRLTKCQRRFFKKRYRKLLKERGYDVVFDIWLKKGNCFRYLTCFVAKELADECVSALCSRGIDSFVRVVKL